MTNLHVKIYQEHIEPHLEHVSDGIESVADILASEENLQAVKSLPESVRKAYSRLLTIKNELNKAQGWLKAIVDDAV